MPARLAVLIDADNISAALAPAIFARVAELGVPIIRRLYGRPEAVLAWDKEARAELYELRAQLPISVGKNGADIALVIGAMDILHDGMADAFCIVSNDHDFVPLAVRLRAVNRSVHSICTLSDERVHKAYDSVFELPPAKPVKRVDKIHSDSKSAPASPIVDAFRKVVSAQGKSEFGLSEVGALLRDVAPGIVPPPGKGKLRKYLEETGSFVFIGKGPAIRVGLKAA